MTDFEYFLRVASVLCRKIERYVLTVKLNTQQRGGVFYVSNYGCGISGDGIAQLTLDQLLQGGCFESPRMFRLDAVTVPSFPVDPPDEIMSLLMPGAISLNGIPLRSTPGDLIASFSEAWHTMLDKYCFAPREGFTELRLNAGQTPYAPTPDRTYVRGDGRRELVNVTPHSGYGLSSSELAYINSSDYQTAYMWLCRAFFELLPAPMYHRIISGNASSTRTSHAQTEETVYMPLSLTDPTSVDAAERVLAEEINGLNRALNISTAGSCLGARHQGDLPYIQSSSTWYVTAGAGNSCDSGDETGLYEHYDRFSILKQDVPVARSLNDYFSISYSELEGDSILARAHRGLVEQHNGDDAAAALFAHAWDTREM